MLAFRTSIFEKGFATVNNLGLVPQLYPQFQTLPMYVVRFKMSSSLHVQSWVQFLDMLICLCMSIAPRKQSVSPPLLCVLDVTVMVKPILLLFDDTDVTLQPQWDYQAGG